MLRPLVRALCWFYLSRLGTLALWTVIGVGALGLQPFAISSGSMRPMINPGDLVLGDDGASVDLRAGDVITFDDPVRSEVVTHRIVEVTDDGSYRTRGDASAAVDPALIGSGDVVAVPELLVPMVARPPMWLREGELLVFATWLAVTVAAAAAVRSPLARAGVGAGEGLLGVDAPRSGVGGRPALVRVTALAVVIDLAVALGLVVAGTSTASAFTGTSANDGNALGGAVLDAPANVDATASCVTLAAVVDVDWATDPDAVAHRVLRSTTSGGPDTLVGTSVTTSYSDLTVVPGTTHHHVVRATAGLWQRAQSSQVSVTPSSCL